MTISKYYDVDVFVLDRLDDVTATSNFMSTDLQGHIIFQYMRCKKILNRSSCVEDKHNTISKLLFEFVLTKKRVC